ncbi:CALM [Mytilus edulis]|uniref:CALM n=1 Tax=Mytilus edulis TaxID=6550 RepID=A0A8S3RJQ5_MYTED|nr:CALM [Mytilus edulis]
MNTWSFPDARCYNLSCCGVPAGQFSEETISDWRESFSLFDKNRDGVICCRELGGVMRSIGQTPTDDDVQKMVSDADKDGNGTVDFDEFVAMMSRYYSTMDPEKEMRDAFRVFDKDGNGYISKSELKSVMHSLGEKLNDQEIEEMIRAADADKDGAINYSGISYIAFIVI